MQRKLLGIINVDFDTAGQVLIIYCAFVKYLRKIGNKIKHCISCLCISRKPMIQLGRRCCIISRPMIMCVNETYSKVGVGKHLSDVFPIKSGLEQVDALLPLLLNFESMPLRGFR